MKVLVEGDFCIGDGTCSMVCPEIFAIDGDVAMTSVGVDEDVPAELEEPCREAAESCPVMAIILIESGDVRFPDPCGVKRLSCRSPYFLDPSLFLNLTGGSSDIGSGTG